jgi:MFS family permease
MSIKLQDFDSKFNDISLVNRKYEADRSPSAYKQKQQNRILCLISFLTALSRAASMVLPSIILTQYSPIIDDKDALNSFSDLNFYNILVSASASVVWVFISNRVGRKLALNICLIGSALTIILYGFIKSTKYLHFINGLNGVFSCNTILIKTMIGEANNKISRPNAFRYLPIINMVAGILGPAITTLISISQLEHIDFDKGTISIAGFPNLIPSLIASGISIAAYILSYYYLRETLTDNRSKSDESAIVEKKTDQTMTLAKSKKISIFGLNLTRNSLLLLILSSLLSLVYPVYFIILKDCLITVSSKGGLNLKPEHTLVVAPLSPIIMVTILLKYPYIIKNFSALKQLKAGFPAVGVLFILSIILTLIAKSGNTFVILSLYAILYSIESGINTLRNISFDLLLAESAEIFGNLATLYSISNVFSGISNIFGTGILMAPLFFKQFSTFSIQNSLPFPLNCIISWFLVILSLIGYWLSSKIEITSQKNQEIAREHEF